MFGANKLVASLVGAGSLGAIGTAGAYYGGLFGNDEKQATKTKVTVSVSEQLRKEGFTVLDSSSQPSDWDEVLKDYKSSDSKTFLSKEEERAHKAKCQEVLRLENSDNYLDAKRWCVKKEKMQAVLNRAGFKALKSKDAVEEGETNSWNEKIAKLKTLETEPFKDIKAKIKDGTDHMTNNVKELRAECAKIDVANMNTTDEKFEAQFGLMKEWCSIKKPNLG